MYRSRGCLGSGRGAWRGRDAARKIEDEKISQALRRMARIGSAHERDDIPDDLDRGQDEAERKTPPAEQGRESERLELFLPGAGPADKMITGRPTGQHDHRINPVRLVQVDRAGSPAGRARAGARALDIRFDLLRRQPIEPFQQQSRAIPASCGAKRIAILVHPEQTELLVAVVANRHGMPRRTA